MSDSIARFYRGWATYNAAMITSVLMRMISHDAYHAGELSQILGAAGLTQVDLWPPQPGGAAARDAASGEASAC